MARVEARIAGACARAGRERGSVSILAVTKGVPVDRLHAALAAGMKTFAENRVQEAEAKAPQLADVSWQMVGRLQSNKVSRAVRLFDAIHSVDSVELAERIARVAVDAGRDLFPVYLQVNVDADPAKQGFRGEELATAAPRIAALPGLRVAGLMTVGRLTSDADEARPTFRALRDLRESLRAAKAGIGAGLSMGMSDDFEVAVEEGATVVRLGRVLFGERPAA